MSVNFQQVREQIRRAGEMEPLRAEVINKLRSKAKNLLTEGSIDLEVLHNKVAVLVQNHDPNLRCALPMRDKKGVFIPLDKIHPLPDLPKHATLIAADGSQITPDRHAEAYFGLVNIGAIQMGLGSPDAPGTISDSRLIYGEEILDLNEGLLRLKRDLQERAILGQLALNASKPVITFTDGPLELWGARDPQNMTEFKRSLDAYTEVLTRLENLAVITAGYVDKPAATLVVRSLEISMLEEGEYETVKSHNPLRGVYDSDLYMGLLPPGERSAVYSLQARSKQYYRDGLALHFFYLNVGQEGAPWLARVEIPAWVANDGQMLDDLHAALVEQCKVMGGRSYPYLLHRAHEAAVVTLEERTQLAQMINLEMRKRNLPAGMLSQKQADKELGGRKGYERSRKR